MYKESDSSSSALKSVAYSHGTSYNPSTNYRFFGGYIKPVSNATLVLTPRGSTNIFISYSINGSVTTETYGSSSAKTYNLTSSWDYILFAHGNTSTSGFNVSYTVS